MLAPLAKPPHTGIHADMYFKLFSVAGKQSGIGGIHYRLRQVLFKE